ncbi:MAG: tripartite tricarboxylate transporter substrate-binding protein, partial [Dehalococcoidia bacterium]
KYLPDGINIIVQNRPGGGGRVARTLMMRAEPDGYKMAILSAVSAVADKVVFGSDAIGYDYSKFTYFGQIAKEPGVIAVGKHTGWTSIEDVKNAGRPVRGAITGVGSVSFIIGVAFGELVGFETAFVSGYVGSQDAMTGTARGDSDMSIYNPSSMLSFFESGDLIPLMVLDSERHPLLPNVPTSIELGLPEATAGLDLVTRFIYGPPNMPENIANFYFDVVPKTLNDPEFIAWAESAKRPLQTAGPEIVAKSVKVWVDTYGAYDTQIKAAMKALGG